MDPRQYDSRAHADTTWAELIDAEQRRRNDHVPIVAVAPDHSVLHEPFDPGWGSTNGPMFLVWTLSRVYFPVTYDGAESVGSAPRHPVTSPAAPVTSASTAATPAPAPAPAAVNPPQRHIGGE